MLATKGCKHLGAVKADQQMAGALKTPAKNLGLGKMAVYLFATVVNSKSFCQGPSS